MNLLYNKRTKNASNYNCSHNGHQTRVASRIITLLQVSITVTTSISIINIPTSNASRAYPQGCSHESPAFYDYDAYPFPPPNVPARTHNDFSLLRRLGAGKFSDVFEAVEVSSNGSSSASAISTSDQEASSTDNNDDDIDDDEKIDPNALCVIKCLKPVSERKIKRELLVLSHASELPNLARLRAVVIPESYHDEPSTSSKSSSATSKSKGSKSKPNSKASSIKRKNANKNVKKEEGQMPSLVLEHAGPTARWFSHGLGCDLSTLPSKFYLKQKKSNKNTQHEPEPFHLTEYEMKYYLFHLLVALDCLHSRGIMHRDVKPRNVLINRRWPPPNVETDGSNGHDGSNNHCDLEDGYDDPIPLMLIDLGLADFYLPNQRYNVRVASRHYKAPELLLGNEFYDYGVDMWGVGCILAGLLLRREPMFRGKDNVDQLGQIVSILGKQDLLKYCDQYGIQLSTELQKVVQKYTLKTNATGARKSWLTLLNSSTKPIRGKDLGSKNSPCPIPSREGLNLLDKLLVYNHEERLTAKEAMMHPFFDAVRDKVRIEIQNRWVKEHSM
jgi:serine/threonine protein kinase